MIFYMSQNAQGYTPMLSGIYMCFGGPKGIESTEKKTLTVGAGYRPSAARLIAITTVNKQSMPAFICLFLITWV